MATISHKTLTGTQLHENKGVSTATNNTVATASSGATVWQLLTSSNVSTQGKIDLRGQILHVRDQRASNTAGQTYGVGTQAKVLQTTVVNEITGTALSSNQITGCPAGTYDIDFWTKTDSSVTWQPYLYNVTAAATITAGSSLVAAGVAILKGRFTLASTSTLELRIDASGTSSTTAANRTNAGAEVYADLILRKLP